MTDLLTSAQMRALEAAAIASGAVNGLELMERAGLGVVQAILDEWPELRALSGRAVVLCGPGNNGGDGFVVARLLQGLGWSVKVFVYGDASKLPPDARVNFDRWMGMGEVGCLASADFDKADVVVDAIFGTGLSRGFEIPSALVQAYHQLMADGLWWSGEVRPPYIVAIDVVSELDADSGRVLDSAQEWGGQMGAHLTVTFHAPKVGHFLDLAPAIGGKLKVVDLGIDPPPSKARNAALARNIRIVELVERPERNLWGGALAKGSAEPSAQHKYTHGHAVVFSGGAGQGGAARLAARGALRIGAGVVTVACPPDAVAENAARLDAIMLRAVVDADALAAMLQDQRINALCLGPGMGVQRAAGMLPAVFAAAQRATVLDADALTAVSQSPDVFAALHQHCVLTPHAGEFARLFPDIAARLAAPATKGPAYSKVDACREAAERAGCVVLFKGADTVIAEPTGRCAINSAHYDRAAPWLATAGSGDVLAGFVTGLLARGFSPFDAACTGAWLHVECARRFGPGLIAEDLPEALPGVLRDLGL